MVRLEIDVDLEGKKQPNRLRIIEPVIQKYFNDEQLEIINIAETNLLPPGENYGSLISKLDLSIHRKDANKEEHLHIVGKENASSDKPVTIWPLMMKKELFIYTELWPMYRKLERGAGISKNDLIDFLPGYIGHMNSSGDDRIDDSSILLMENMKSKGFYSLDRRIGLDVHHASKALALLARYHAIGIAMRMNEPSFTKVAIENCMIFGITMNLVGEIYGKSRQTFKSLQWLTKYSDKLEFSIKSLEQTNLNDLQNPWNTVTHGDFWVNNILFHKDDKGDVDDVKLVDFQAYVYHSALIDLPYFFGTSLDETTCKHHFDELLDIYYESFVRTLARMNSDTAIYSRQNFECELKRVAKICFSYCVVVLRLMTFEVDEKDKNNRELHKTVLSSDISHAYEEKLIRLIQIYESRNWF